MKRVAADRKRIVRDSYAAFAAGNRSFFEQRLSDDLLFSAPPDPKLDRDGYFERCWPGSGRGRISSHFCVTASICSMKRGSSARA